MHVTEEGDRHETTLHVGRDDERLYITLAVTNTGEDPITAQSGGGKWASMQVVDEHDVRRLERMGTTQAMTGWTIPPGKSLVTCRATETPQEVRELDVSFVDYVPDIEEADTDERRYYTPNVDLPSDEDVSMTVHASVDLSGLATKFSQTFTPAELPDPLDHDDVFDIAEEPRAGNSPMSVWETSDESDVDGYSASYTEQTDE